VGLDRLIQYLLDEDQVTPDQIAEARRTQGFFGGQIGSHILKLGFVDEASLGKALSKVTGVPYASGERLQRASESALASLDPRTAERLRACPIERDGRTVRIAMLDPCDALTLAEVRSATGCEVEPWVTCEYRLYQALEHHYRVNAGRPRAITLAPPLSRERAPQEPRRESAAAVQADDDGSFGPGLDRRLLDADLGHDEHVATHHGSPLDDVLDAIERVDANARRVVTPIDPLERLERVLIAAEDRGRIADAVLGLCAGHAARSALFAAGKEGLRLIAGRGRAFETEQIRARTIPAERSTVLGAVIESRDLFFGVVPPHPANRELYSALGGRLPSMAMVLPILVKSRVAALLYLDDEDRPMRRPDIVLMRRVAGKAGVAFEILLLRGKLRKV